MTKLTSRRDSLERWAPVLLIYLGMIDFLFCIVFWAVTARLEPLLLGTGGSLMGLSQGLDAFTKSRKDHPEVTAPPIPDSTVGSGE